MAANPDLPENVDRKPPSDPPEEQNVEDFDIDPSWDPPLHQNMRDYRPDTNPWMEVLHRNAHIYGPFGPSGRTTQLSADGQPPTVLPSAAWRPRPVPWKSAAGPPTRWPLWTPNSPTEPSVAPAFNPPNAYNPVVPENFNELMQADPLVDYQQRNYLPDTNPWWEVRHRHADIYGHSAMHPKIQIDVPGLPRPALGQPAGQQPVIPPTIVTDAESAGPSGLGQPVDQQPVIPSTIVTDDESARPSTPESGLRARRKSSISPINIYDEESAGPSGLGQPVGQKPVIPPIIVTDEESARPSTPESGQPGRRKSSTPPSIEIYDEESEGPTGFRQPSGGNWPLPGLGGHPLLSPNYMTSPTSPTSPPSTIFSFNPFNPQEGKRRRRKQKPKSGTARRRKGRRRRKKRQHHYQHQH